MYLFSSVPNIICWLLNVKTNNAETLSTEIRIRNWGKLYRCSCLVLNTTISNNDYKYKHCYNLYTGESIDVILRKIFIQNEFARVKVTEKLITSLLKGFSLFYSYRYKIIKRSSKIWTNLKIKVIFCKTLVKCGSGNIRATHTSIFQ